MLYVQHRVNSIAALERTPEHYGVEIDLRDRGERLILQHDPFGDGEDFADYLRHYRHALLILNVKSERIEHRVLELLRAHDIQNYFFLDSSFPMIHLLSNLGERKLAMRFSEWEPWQAALKMRERVEWVWVDCFTRLPFDAESYAQLRSAFKLCLVSPELQGRSVDEIAAMARQLEPFPIDAICTKRPDLWLSLSGRRAA